MSPLISVFMPSYNKPEYVLHTVNSVLSQSVGDIELWVLENSTDGVTRDAIKRSGLLSNPLVRYEEINLSPEFRKTTYATAYLANQYYPLANGKYIFYISDDDLIEPWCFKVCSSFLDSHPDKSVVYFTMQIVRIDSPTDKPRAEGYLRANKVRGPGEARNQVDGGQIFHRASCLDVVGQPYFPESAHPSVAGTCDADFLEALVCHYPFYPIPALLGYHRITPISTWRRNIGEIKTLAQLNEFRRLVNCDLRYTIDGESESVVIPLK